MGSSGRHRAERVRKRRIPDAAYVIGAGVANQALTLISGPIIARMLGPAGRGEVVTVLAVALLASQFMLSALGGAISRSVAAAHAPARDTVGPFLRGWIGWSALTGVFAAVATGVALRGSVEWTTLVAMAFVVTFSGGVHALFRSMVYGEDGIRAAMWAEMWFMLAYVGSIVAVFVVRPTNPPAVVLTCYFFAQLVGAAMMWRALRKPEGKGTDRSVRTEVHRFARSSYLSSIGALDRLGLDSIIIGQILGASALGLYSVASSVGMMPAVMVGTLAVPLMPKMVAAGAREGAVLLRKWTLASVVIFAVMIPAMWIIVGPGIRIFFGHDFEGAIWCARWLLLANAAFAFRLLWGAAALAQDREKLASRISLLSSIALLGALVVGSYWGGLNGAAVASIIASVLSCAAIAAVVSWTGKGVKKREITPEETELAEADQIEQIEKFGQAQA